MNALVIAKKDFREAVRSWVLQGLTVLFAIFTSVGVYAFSMLPAFETGGGKQVEFSVVYGLLTPAGTLVPIIGLLVGYKAIAGERESGSLNCLLGLPHTRRDVVLGKVLGRTGVVAVSILVGFTVGGVAMAAISGSIPFVSYLAFTGTTILFGMTFVALSVGLSATAGSTSRAAWGAFGLFVTFQFVWDLVRMAIRYVVTGSAFPKPPLSDWDLLLARLNPQSAYSTAVTSVLPEDQTIDVTSMMMQSTGGGRPFFLEGWFGFVVLVTWGVVPLAIGYLRFRRAELA